MSAGSVPVGPFQDAFRRSGLSAGALAKELGWVRERRYRWEYGSWRLRRTPFVQGDASRVLRRLGLMRYTCRGEARYAEQMTYEMAERFCRVLDLDPVDVGL